MECSILRIPNEESLHFKEQQICFQYAGITQVNLILGISILLNKF